MPRPSHGEIEHKLTRIRELMPEHDAYKTKLNQCAAQIGIRQYERASKTLSDPLPSGRLGQLIKDLRQSLKRMKLQ